MFNLFKSNKLDQKLAYQQLKEDHTIKLIDVRTKQEFKTGHIDHAINIPLDTLADRIEKTVNNKETKVFVVCHSGSRARQAVALLKQLGYTDVYNIGGTATWPYGLRA